MLHSLKQCVCQRQIKLEIIMIIIMKEVLLSHLVSPMITWFLIVQSKLGSASWIKWQSLWCQHPSNNRCQFELVVPLLIQLLAIAPRKTAIDSSSAWAYAPIWEIQMRLVAPDFMLAWPWLLLPSGEWACGWKIWPSVSCLYTILWNQYK